ncbi:MAG: branched-chain amino acid ABC transporter substrate-binding protein, partial [Deferribacteraceae bacterium]|nr:branched-chain amino acid ABC transporter substrate-binding protein [Deferribacteraceae bacterium]
MKKFFLTLSIALVFTSLSFAADFIVGVQAPITGSMASEGQGMQKAVELLADQANAAGGINGDTIRVIACDDEGTTSKAAICAKNLVDQGAKVVIGSYTSSATEASQAFYARNKVIQTSDATAASLTKKDYPTYFRASFNDDIEGEFTANFFVNVRGYQRVAIISDYGTFSDGLAKAVREHLQKLGGKNIVVSYEKINAGAQDYKAVLTKIKERNPDV